MAASFWDPRLLADAFCERRTLSPLDEPLNLATNLVLVAAAIALIRLARRRDRVAAPVPASVQVLIALVIVMALASIVFHAFPAEWSAALDKSAVYAFVLYFIACFMRWMLAWPWRRVLLAFPLALAAALLPAVALPGALYGAAALLPAVLGSALFAAVLERRGDPEWRAFAFAGASFALATVFHRVDRPLCEMLPTGTHFLWHAFSGITVYLISAAVVRRARQRAGSREQDEGRLATIQRSL